MLPLALIINEHGLLFARQKPPRAPTLSWVSVDCGVEFLKGAVEPALLDIQKRSLIITGLPLEIGTIRYQVEGSYCSEYEQHRPWM